MEAQFWQDCNYSQALYIGENLPEFGRAANENRLFALRVEFFADGFPQKTPQKTSFLPFPFFGKGSGDGSVTA